MEIAVDTFSMVGEALGPLGESVWEQTLGRPLVAVETEPQKRSSMIQGQVQVTGEWRGTLVLQVSPLAARRAAAAMLGAPADAVAKADVWDVVGELANILAGNIKSLVSDHGCHLSLPTVVEGGDFEVHVPHSRVVARRAFTADTEPVVVTLLEAQPRG